MSFWKRKRDQQHGSFKQDTSPLRNMDCEYKNICRVGRYDYKGMWGDFGGDGYDHYFMWFFHICICTHIYIYTHIIYTYTIGHFKHVQFVIYQLYLNKSMKITTPHTKIAEEVGTSEERKDLLENMKQAVREIVEKIRRFMWHRQCKVQCKVHWRKDWRGHTEKSGSHQRIYKAK